MKFKRIHLFAPLVIPMLILSLMLPLSGCIFNNEEKILGEWETHTPDQFGAIHYFEFENGVIGQEFTEKRIPTSNKSIGFEVKGTWHLNIYGRLYISYDISSFKALTYDDDYDRSEVASYVTSTKRLLENRSSRRGSSRRNKRKSYYVKLKFIGKNKIEITSASDTETLYRIQDSSIPSFNVPSPEGPITRDDLEDDEETDDYEMSTFREDGSSDEFVGLIDGKYKINMQLNLTAGEGRYYYLNSGSGDYLDLEVTSYNLTTGKITIIERNDKGQQTGKFEGTLHSDGHMNGWFTNYKGKEMPFSLDPNNAP